MASLTEVLVEIGDKNIGVQFLQNCISKCRTVKKVTEVSFLTQEMTPNDVMTGASKKLGIVLWVGVDDYEEAVKRLGVPRSKPS